MDYNHEAKKIIYEHCGAVMSCCVTEFESNQDMYEFTLNECAFILTENLMQGKYTPMQYNAIRNELSQILWAIFEPHIEAEEAKRNVWMNIHLEMQGK